jgi:hypothetical protein
MKKTLLTIFALAFLFTASSAQLWKLRRYEATGSIGTTQFYGDIGGFSKGENALGIKDFTFHQTRFNLSAGFKYRLYENVNLRINLTIGSFHSTDVRGSNENRGFEAKTFFFEPTFVGEYYFFKNKVESSYLSLKRKDIPHGPFFDCIDAYAFTGFGQLSYNVTPNDKLAPYTGETTGFTPVIPLGIGANYYFSGYINFGVELTARYTFADDLDGYTSIYSKSNDAYQFLNFTFTYKIYTEQKQMTSVRRRP